MVRLYEGDRSLDLRKVRGSGPLWQGWQSSPSTATAPQNHNITFLMLDKICARKNDLLDKSTKIKDMKKCIQEQ